MKLVAFRAPIPALSENRLFIGGSFEHFGDITHLIDPYREMASILLENGYKCVTDDVIDLQQADALVFFDPPSHRQELSSLRLNFPKLKLILQILETPLGRLWALDQRNHTDFDAVLTYDASAVKLGPKYFSYRIPYIVTKPSSDVRIEEWPERRLACMVANVPNVRSWLPRRTGLGVVRRGWRLTPSTWLNYVTEGGSLYQHRLDAAKALAKSAEKDFEIYGPSWDSIGDEHVLNCWQGVWKKSKIDLLSRFKFNIAFENCRNDVGYVSEKILDALVANSIPVYLGNSRISEIVPRGCYVDAAGLKSGRGLSQLLKSISATRSKQMLDCGRAFVSESLVDVFGSAQYASGLLKAVRFTLGI